MGLYDAWLDESGSNRALDPGVYILGAVMCEDQHVESTATRCGPFWRAARRGNGERRNDDRAEVS